jgi:hypothetical protein
MPAEPQIPLHLPSRQPNHHAHETLLDLAAQRNTADTATADTATADTATADTAPVESPPAAEAALWSLSLAMLHFTLDVLVQHQYAQEVSWSASATAAGHAFAGEAPIPADFR